MNYRLSVGAALLALASAAALQAQAANSFHFNLAAGASFPTGNFGNGTDVGYNLTAGVGMKPAGSPVGFRFEGNYNEWNVNAVRDFKVHAGGLIANATLDLTGSATTRGTANAFYLIGGLGTYDTGNNWNTGFNLGGGFRFPLTGFSAYLEARYHSISNGDVKFVPVVFGLVF